MRRQGRGAQYPLPLPRIASSRSLRNSRRGRSVSITATRVSSRPASESDSSSSCLSAAPKSTAAAMRYFGSLGLTLEQRYETLNRDTHKAWNWNRGDANGGTFASTTPDLARALRRNPHLRVFVASGRYDLGTPYSATDWSLAHLDVPAEVAARIEHRYYDAGHMMYTRSEDLAQLKADLAHWLG